MSVRVATQRRQYGGRLILDAEHPMESARAFVELHHTHEGIATLLHHSGEFFAYEPAGGGYATVPAETIRAALYRFLDEALVVVKNDDDGDLRYRYKDYKPNSNTVGNVADALKAVCHIPVDPPCWLRERDAKGDPGFDPFDVVAHPDGLLHIPTRYNAAKTPAFFTLSALDFPYCEQAPQPARWLRLLKELWPADDEAIATLQEIFGYLLVPCTRLQKIFMLLGPKRSGKGTVGRVLRRLLGVRNVAAPTMASLALPFGLQNLIGKPLALIADARLSGRNDSAVIAERLLSISGEDPQSIGRKYLPDWNGVMTARFMVMTNELPTINDASGALASRFIVLRLTESFYGKEDPGLLDKLIPELPGILNWALDGYDRLSERGYFVQPTSSTELIQQLEDLGSPIGAFLRECCEVGPAYDASQWSVNNAWTSWCSQNNRAHPGTIQTLGKNLAAAIPGLRVIHPRNRLSGQPERHWVGLKLKPGRHSLVRQA